MSKIKLLDKSIYDKIAAGEVIEQPISVVKELVENSIDAGSTQITVEIKKGGKEYIRVSDNGCGIERDDIKIAFLPHATSKISSVDDLIKLSSLGFRGEALSSICAVSRLELITKTDADKTALHICSEASEIVSENECAGENGTSVIVKDLFYNIPARRKFLKADNHEASLIAEFVSRISLAYTNIKFRFINNGTIMFATPGKCDLYKTVLTVYGINGNNNLIGLDYKRDGFSIKGLISSPLEYRSTRKQEIYFVNGRLVKSNAIDRAISLAYSDKLFDGQYPSVYIFLELDPASVDVNIHPRKAEIKLLDEENVIEFIVESIRKALLKPEVLEVKSEPKSQNISEYHERFDSVSTPKFTYSPQEVQPQLNVSNNIFKELRSKESETFIQEKIVSYDFNENRLKFCSLSPICQVFVTYILASDYNNFYIIDQHAAHERIMFEKFLAAFNNDKNAGQLLLVPIVIELSPSEMLVADEASEILFKLGFSLEDFGGNSFVVKQIPSFMGHEEAEDFLNNFFSLAENEKGLVQAKKDSIISRSCKAAIKAHDKLSIDEMQSLFAQLDECENPYSCPHGRPTFLKFSEYEIERLFKRK